MRRGGLVRVLHAARALQAEVRDSVRERVAGGGAQPGRLLEGRGTRVDQLGAQLRARGGEGARALRAALHRALQLGTVR